MIPPLWTSDAIADATGGTASAAFGVSGVSFDSREILGGELFVAMQGTQSDGHAHVAAAVARGAAGCLVQTAVDTPHVLVADSMAALQALGRAARARTGATVIGITGSAGKTGTKEALRRALQWVAPERTHWSVKSYNNHTGVPLSLARMPADTQFAIFEMGMNHAGEIAVLTRMVRPHIAAITTIASAHIENFANEEGIAHAKAEIFEGVAPGGIAIWPYDNTHAPILQQKADALGLRSLSFGWDSAADVRVLRADVGAEGTDLLADVMGQTISCRIGMAGRHWVSNALLVLAAVAAAGGDLAQAGLALADLGDLPGRGARLRLDLPGGGSAVVLDESYNANPASMAATLQVLKDTPARRRIAILGAMRELGDRSDALHAGLADPIRSAGISELALVGPEMAALRLDRASYLPDAAAALTWARGMIRDGDVLLVKGSNSIGLGQVVAALATHSGEARP